MKGHEVLYGQGKTTTRGTLPPTPRAEPAQFHPVSHTSPSHCYKPQFPPNPLFLLLPCPDLSLFSSETAALSSLPAELLHRRLLPLSPDCPPPIQDLTACGSFLHPSSPSANSQALRANGPNLFGLELPRGTGLVKTELGLGKHSFLYPSAHYVSSWQRAQQTSPGVIGG